MAALNKLLSLNQTEFDFNNSYEQLVCNRSPSDKTNGPTIKMTTIKPSGFPSCLLEFVYVYKIPLYAR